MTFLCVFESICKFFEYSNRAIGSTPSLVKDFIPAAVVEEVVVAVLIAAVVVVARVLILVQKDVGLLDNPKVHWRERFCVGAEVQLEL